jgi:hypothetical protein
MKAYRKKEACRRDLWEQLHTDRRLQKEIARLHELTGCTTPRCTQSDPARLPEFQAECLGIQALCFRHPDGHWWDANGQDGSITFLELTAPEREAVARATGEARAIHAQLGCREELCQYTDWMIQCVKQNVLDYPEEERPARIDLVRRGNEEEEARAGMFRLGMEVGYARSVRNLKSVLLLAADGTMKSLLAFDAADLERWARTSGAQSAAWSKRHAWFERARAALKEAGVERLGDLPAAQLCELGEAAAAVWKGQEAEALAD